jgi:cysteine desulfurase/selenocysteine lyase
MVAEPLGREKIKVPRTLSPHLPMNWSDFRSQFPVTSRWAFLDHAAVAPLPRTAMNALAEYGANLAENGVAAVKDWIDRIGQIRRLAARLINAPSSDDVFFIPNTTHGLGVIAEGFPWNPGDNLILAAEEYPANQYPWMNLTYRGVEVRRIPSRDGRLSIDDYRAAIDRRTRLITVSTVEFASGFRNDLALLGELCREHGLFLCLDAIQSLGVFPLDVQKTPIDALAADGHKWLLGPEGAGIGFIRREWVERLHPIGVGANSVINPFAYSTIDFRLKPHAGRWEGGAYNVPGIAALGASLGLLLDTGIDAIERRVLDLTNYLCERAVSRDWRVFSSRVEGEKSGIVSLIPPKMSSLEVMKRCRLAGVVVNSRADRVRLSPHAYNTEEEIDRFLDAAR